MPTSVKKEIEIIETAFDTESIDIPEQLDSGIDYSLLDNRDDKSHAMSFMQFVKEESYAQNAD